MANVLLDIHNLRTYYHMHGYTVRAVDGVDFVINEGESIGVVGESGCGKSQTAMSIMRLIPDPPGRIEEGEIFLKGKNLLTLGEDQMRKIRGNDISMIFQEPMTSLNPVFTVGYQLSEGLLLHRDMTKEDALSESLRLLKMVGISDVESRVKEYPFQLSGGLRQRVMIAMAMACEPSLMIADEPTTALDVSIQAQILRLMRDLQQKQNTATMFITHDLAVIAGFTQRVMVMYAGVVVEMAAVREIFKHPLHPYTQGLLSSIPVLGANKNDAEGKRRLLHTIPGTLPDPKRPMIGCRFAGRCSRVMKKCREAEPELVTIDTGHQVRCFLHSDEIRKTPSHIDVSHKPRQKRKKRGGRRG
ncbi:MAG: ABC transporter ATP-binding protein [Spirochaetota bacterium]